MKGISENGKQEQARKQPELDDNMWQVLSSASGATTMDARFQPLIDSLHPKYRELLDMAAVTLRTLPLETPTGGVYLFSEREKPMYVGRTRRKFSDRLPGHVNTADDCPFAFRLAREATGTNGRRYGANSRAKLLEDAEFREQYEAAKQRIREMSIRWVHEADPVRQALLEIYVSVVLQTPYNDFDTH